MNDPIQFLLEHGYRVVFMVVLADQLGLPVPAFPVLVAAGAMSGAGGFHFWMILLLAAGEAFLSDAIWYELGRYRGARVLGLLCRVSLQPDVCIRQTEESFLRCRWRSLLFARFVPWLNVVAAPMAGMMGMSRCRFHLWNGAGALLWAGTLVGLGFLLRDELNRALILVGFPGKWVVPGGFVLLLVFLVAKFVRRQRVMRPLRLARITAEELKRRLEAGEKLVIVDLR